MRKARRTDSFDSADIIKAAGESSRTDTSTFIEKQRRILDEIKSSRSSRNRDNDEDADMRDEDRTSQFDFEDYHFANSPPNSQIDFRDDHFKSTPPSSTSGDNRPIAKQPGFSSVEFRSQEPSEKTSYPDYVHIEKDAYEKLMAKHEDSRYGMS